MNTLNLEKIGLKHPISSLNFIEDLFREDNVHVKFYTRLPNFITLMFVFDFILPFITHTSRSTLSKLQQFILTLMRLTLKFASSKLGLPFWYFDVEALIYFVKLFMLCLQDLIF